MKQVFSQALSTVIIFIICMQMVNAKQETGGIKGQVDYCGKGGVEGMRIYFPGRQYMLFTAQDGMFQFDNIPVDTYQLNYMLNDKVLFNSLGVTVVADRINDIGTVAFCDKPSPVVSGKEEQQTADCAATPEAAQCADKDKDGVAAALDCDDNNANARPGMLEQCDGIDNDCNGIVDDVASLLIANGFGKCENGKTLVESCQKKFADCDKDPANGCEVNLMNDNENCGKCGNFCSSLEMCRLGFC